MRKFYVPYGCSVFSGSVRACEELCLQSPLEGSDRDGETKDGKLFQTRAAATGNVRSPIVECFDQCMADPAVLKGEADH